MALPDPVIVIPGITANYLFDNYPLPPDDIWTVLSLNYERAGLHPDDTRYEATEPALVRPGQLYEIAYKELVDELRHNLAPSSDQPVPVFPFSLDWRQPLETIEPQLRAFVDEVIARTALLPHYAKDKYAQRGTVSLVGHSMGGIHIAGYLEHYKKDSKVAKVATLASPFKGSFEAVIKITTGTANLGATPPSSREREAARITPALYYILPRVPDGIQVDPGLPDSLFDPRAWQTSILRTIEEYIRLHGTSQRNRPQQAAQLFARFLSDAKAHRDRIEAFRLDQAGLAAKDWLCVVGVDSTTRVHLQIVKLPDGTADFRFHSEDRDNKWSSKTQKERVFTGDGTVPFLGAVPSFLGLENLVCVTPDDFGYWEVQDKLTTQIAGFHGILPNMDMLHRLIVRHLTGSPDTHENTWGRRAPGVKTWQPAVQPLKEK